MPLTPLAADSAADSSDAKMWRSFALSQPGRRLSVHLTTGGARLTGQLALTWPANSGPSFDGQQQTGLNTLWWHRCALPHQYLPRSNDAQFSTGPIATMSPRRRPEVIRTWTSGGPVSSSMAWQFSKQNLRPAPFYTGFRTRPCDRTAIACDVDTRCARQWQTKCVRHLYSSEEFCEFHPNRRLEPASG